MASSAHEGHDDFEHDQHDDGDFEDFGAGAGGFVVQRGVGFAHDGEFAVHCGGDGGDAELVQGGGVDAGEVDVFGDLERVVDAFGEFGDVRYQAVKPTSEAGVSAGGLRPLRAAATWAFMRGSSASRSSS